MADIDDAAVTQKAIDRLSKLIRREPKNADAYFERGTLYLQQYEKDDAQFDFTRAIRLRPDFAEAYKARAKTWNDLDQAIIDYNEAIRLIPNDIEAYIGRGTAFYSKAIWEEESIRKQLRLTAIADLTAALRLDPANEHALNGRGVCWGSIGEHDKAIADYTECIRLNPTDTTRLHFRASTWEEKGDFDKALADYSECIRIEPDSGYYYSLRGDLWQKRGEYAKAIAEYSEAIRVDPTSWNIGSYYHSRADLWGVTGEYERAKADYEASIRARESVYSTRDLALLMSTCPDDKFRNGPRAVELATRACEMSGWESYDCVEALAAAYAEAGDFAAAIKWQQTAVGLVSEKNKAERIERLALYQDGMPLRKEPTK